MMAAVPRRGIVYYGDGDDTNDDMKTLILKRAWVCEDTLNSAQPTVTVQYVLARTDGRFLLRRVYFLNEGRSRYVSVGFYPSDNYHVLAEFGGPRIAPITLTEHHFRTLMEALPALCDAMQRGELYTRKDGAFRLRSCKTNNCARLYRDKKCVSFTLTDLRYMMTMLHMVEAQQQQFILAQADVISYAYSVLGSLVFAELPSSNGSQILYDQLFEEFKLRLI